MSSENLTGNTVGSLTLKQQAVLIGTLLGDGALRKQRGKLNALLEVNHAFKYQEYVDWKYKIFQQYVLTPPKRRKGNGKRVAYRFTTRSMPVFTEFYNLFYPKAKKVIPDSIILNPLSLAVWFMDDGSKSRSSYYLNTQQFEPYEQEKLFHFLARDFGITGTLNRDKQYYRIRVDTKSSRILENVVEKYLLACFRYKLSDDPVTTEPKGEALVKALLS